MKVAEVLKLFLERSDEWIMANKIKIKALKKIYSVKKGKFKKNVDFEFLDNDEERMRKKSCVCESHSTLKRFMPVEYDDQYQMNEASIKMKPKEIQRHKDLIFKIERVTASARLTPQALKGVLFKTQFQCRLKQDPLYVTASFLHSLSTGTAENTDVDGKVNVESRPFNTAKQRVSLACEIAS
uniref:Uncharacterized protein n=1 Tax=Tanacetum cinerariifolium TaxID=118510 RepID=A0A6L2JSU9_TANCI|nr:hypothetical protein [Tanacetum cinerariifolium]